MAAETKAEEEEEDSSFRSLLGAELPVRAAVDRWNAQGGRADSSRAAEELANLRVWLDKYVLLARNDDATTRRRRGSDRPLATLSPCGLLRLAMLLADDVFWRWR